MSHTQGVSPLIVLGIDAGELELVSRWTEDETLPNLARLRREGTWAPLDGIHDFNSFSVWPSFATGAPASEHAYYSHMQLQPGTYKLVATDAEGNMRLKPWWAQLQNPRIRSCIFDVPKILPVAGVNGVQILEWGAKSPAANPRSEPPELVDQLYRRYGRHDGSRLDEDVTESPAYFRRLLRALVESCRMRTRICLDLLQQEPWDLFAHVFSETHSAGHRFIHFFDGDTSRRGGHHEEQLRDALVTIYKEIDRGIGQIRAALPEHATIVTCSMHGMGINENSEASELLPELLRRYSSIARDAGGPAHHRLASRLFGAAHAATPSIVRDKVKHRLSQGLRKRLRMTRLSGIHDTGSWPMMKAFTLPSDEGGFVRINLQGREPNGMVTLEEYPLVLNELVGVFEKLYDPTTGEKAVRRVHVVREAHEGKHLNALPDLVIEWTRQPIRALESPQFGHLGHYQPHRAGTHRPRGYLLAAGPGIARGAQIAGGSVFDIAPTLSALLGEPPLPQFVGQALVRRNQ